MDSFKPCRSITQTERYLLSFDPQDCFDYKWLKSKVSGFRPRKKVSGLYKWKGEVQKISSVSCLNHAGKNLAPKCPIFSTLIFQGQLYLRQDFLQLAIPRDSRWLSTSKKMPLHLHQNSEVQFSLAGLGSHALPWTNHNLEGAVLSLARPVSQAHLKQQWWHQSHRSHKETNTAITARRGAACTADANSSCWGVHGSATCAVTWGPALRRAPAWFKAALSPVWNSSQFLKEGPFRVCDCTFFFHFPLDPTNYAANPAATRLCVLGSLPQTLRHNPLRDKETQGTFGKKLALACVGWNL